MKIVIIGGGISGCTAYLQFKKHLPQPPPPSKHEITICEAYDTNINATHKGRDGETHSSTLVVGGGLGLFANGLNVLKRLDGEMFRDIGRGGYAIAHQNLRSKNGTLLIRMDPTADPEPDGKRVHLLGKSRHSLWRNMRLRIPDCDVETRRVVRLLRGRAVGMWGLVGVGEFISTEEVRDLVEEGSMNLVFGSNGFFGYFFSNSAPSEPDRDSVYQVSKPGESLGWWSTYAVDECPDPKTLDMEAVAKQLRERRGDWKDPAIRKILGSLHVKSMYPTRTSPQLPTWERDGVVLGDAAHALPSTSGQGASQALEDVEAFTLLLSQALRGLIYRGSSPNTMAYKGAITAAARHYMEIRHPRVQSILENAQRMQNSKRRMGIIAEYAMYCAMWIAGCFPRLMSRPLKGVTNYNISEEVKGFIDRQRG